MKEFFKVWALLLGIQTLSIAQNTAPTVNELIESAIQKSNKLNISNQKIESSLQDMRSLKSAYLPTAELEGKYGFSALAADIKTDATTLYLPDGAHQIPALDNGITSTANLVNANLSVNSLLYSGGKVPALKKALNEKIKGQTAILEKDRQQITENILTAYDQILLLAQVKIVLDESQKRLDLHKATAQKALDYGLITKYDVQKLEVAQSQLDSKKMSYEGQRDLLVFQLETLTGIESERLKMISAALEPALISEGQNSIENRAELVALEHAINANKFNIEVAKTWWKPKVLASASLGYMNLFDAKIKGKSELPMGLGHNTLVTNSLQLAPNFMVGVGFRWELFDGNKGKREVSKAKIETKIAELEKAEAHELLDLNLQKCKTDFNNSKQQISAAKKQMEVAQDALGLATKEFKTGLLKSTDLVDAENDFQKASLEYQQSIFNQRRAAFALLKATGSLNYQNLN